MEPELNIIIRNVFKDNLFSENCANIGQIQKDLISGIETKIASLRPKKVPKICSNCRFEGACIDTDAAKSVCGLHQKVAYSKDAAIKFRPLHSTTCLTFGNTLFKGKEKIEIRIPSGNDGIISVKVYVVDADLPLLIKLTDLRK